MGDLKNLILICHEASPCKFNCVASYCSLSVAKWIHLNWGDDGLITLFVKIWRFLRPVLIILINHIFGAFILKHGKFILYCLFLWSVICCNFFVSSRVEFLYWNLSLGPHIKETGWCQRSCIFFFFLLAMLFCVYCFWQFSVILCGWRYKACSFFAF